MGAFYGKNQNTTTICYLRFVIGDFAIPGNPG
jgi:hypothetical protein